MKKRNPDGRSLWRSKERLEQLLLDVGETDVVYVDVGVTGVVDLGAAVVVDLGVTVVVDADVHVDGE